MAKEIENLLTERGLPFQREALVGGRRMDFAIPSPERPTLIISLSEAVFHDDEAQRALDHLGVVEELHRQGVPARLVLVILGYVSPEVTRTLGRIVSEYVIYSPLTFDTQFREALTRSVEPRTIATDAERDLLEHQLQDVRAQLEALAATREVEAKTLEELVSGALVTQQTQDRREERRAPGCSGVA